MTTHTPGPWHVETWQYEQGKRSEIMVQTNQDAICKVENLWCPDDRHDEKLANARLIAAAPAMLDALQFTRNLLRNLTTDEFQRGGDEPARDKIDAVLAQLSQVTT